MEKSKVVVVTTGGTIAMRYDPARKGVFPAVTGPQLVEAVPPLEDICSPVVEEFSNIPSPHMTPELMLKLAQKLDQILTREEVAGAIVTHGTDTLEETAFSLDLICKAEKPICITAAMRSGSDISPDGPHNLLCAVKTALSPEASGEGVLVVMNEEIHAARDVTKTHSANPKTFASPGWGPIGYVDKDAVIFRRKSIRFPRIPAMEVISDVHLVKMAAGADSLLLQCLAEKKVRGVVLEGLGRGNVPPAALPGVEAILNNNIPLVLTTRVPSGRVLDVYGYPGGVKPLKEKGVILGGDLSGPKARILLMLVLSITNDLEAIASYFNDPGASNLA